MFKFILGSLFFLTVTILIIQNHRLFLESDSSSRRSADPPGVVLLPVFPLLTDPDYDNSNFGNISHSRLEERMLDFLESLQYSLNHPLVSSVHLMYNQVSMPEYIKQRLGDNTKLTFGLVESTYEVGKVLEYVHENFQNQLVLLTNGDVYPGEGLDRISYTKMKDKRLFYTPTRHGRTERRCKRKPDHCDEDGFYVAAHDTYIFIPTEPLPSDAKKDLQGINWDMYGAEYAMLHMYHDILKYRILNPCYVIYMYHNHCSGLRHVSRPLIHADYDILPSWDLD